MDGKDKDTGRVTGESLVKDLLGHKFVTRKVTLAGTEYTVKTLTSAEYMLFMRVFDWRVAKTCNERVVSNMIIDQVRTECLMPFVLHECDGQPFSPVTEDVLRAWKEMYLYGRCSFMGVDYIGTDSFLAYLFQNLFAPKLMDLPDIVTQQLAETYNKMLKEIESVFKDGDLKKA